MVKMIPFKESDGLGVIEQLVEIISIFFTDEFIDGFNVIEVSFADEEVIGDS